MTIEMLVLSVSMWTLQACTYGAVAWVFATLWRAVHRD